MVERKVFDVADEEFYEYGIEQSGLGDELTVERVSSWFKSYSNQDGSATSSEVYWIDAPYIFAEVEWVTKNKVEYNVFDPELSDVEQNVFKEVRDENVYREGRSDVDFAESIASEFIGERDVDEFKVLSQLTQYNSRYAWVYPFAEDDNVTAVSVMPREQVTVTLRSPTFQEDVLTNMRFDSVNKFKDVFKTIETSRPEEVDGFYVGRYDDSRFQVSTSGSSREIFIEFYGSKQLTLPELIFEEEFLNVNVGSLLWLAAESKQNMLIIGQPSSGRTTLLRSLMDVTPERNRMSIVGDGGELESVHSNVQHYARDEFDDSDSGLRMITDMFPSYLLVDDIDATEASLLFDGMEDGKTVWGSLNAGSFDSMVQRLSSERFSVPEDQIPLFDIIVQASATRIYDEERDVTPLVHRVSTVGEVERQDNGFRISELYHRDSERDNFVEDIDNSYVLEEIRWNNGWTYQQLREELVNRRRVLEALYEAGLTEPSDIRAVATIFEVRQEYVMELVEKFFSGDSDALDEVVDSSE